MRLRKPLTLWEKDNLWPLTFEVWPLTFMIRVKPLSFALNNSLWALTFELYDLGKSLTFALNYLSSSPYPTLIYLGSPPFGGVGGGSYIPSSSAFSNSLFGCCCGWSLGVSSCVALLIRRRLILSMVTSNGTYSSLFGSGEPTLAPK